MANITLSTPKFGFIVATRAALALGVGLLVSERLEEGNRRRAGAMLAALGVLATIPAVMFIRGKR